MRSFWHPAFALLTAANGPPRVFYPHQFGRAGESFLSGFVDKDVVVTTWISPNNSHLIKAHRHRSFTCFQLDCPVVFTGMGTINMQSVVCALTIRGDLALSKLWNGETSVTRLPGISMCITSAATRGPLLAVSEGTGQIRIINQDVGTMTAVIRTGKCVTQMCIAGGSDEYHLVCVSNDGLVQVYDIPWHVAHSRSLERPPVKLPSESGVCAYLPENDPVRYLKAYRTAVIATASNSIYVIGLRHAVVVFRKDFRKQVSCGYMVDKVLHVAFSDATTETYNLRVGLD